MPLKIRLVDKKKIFTLQSKYNPENRIAQVKASMRQMFPTKFEIDPDHIYQEILGSRSVGFVSFVDNVTRKSVPVEKTKTREITENGKTTVETLKTMENIEVGESHDLPIDNGPVDLQQKNKLDFLIEERFWKSLIAKTKIPLSTMLIMLAAGGGIFFLVRDLILPLFGVH